MQTDRLQHIAFKVANERSLDIALTQIVEGLASEKDVALARIWLMHPGDICNTCPMRQECPDQTTCLHLVASDGHPIKNTTERKTKLSGEYRRFPLGIRKVGRIGATGEPTLLTCVDQTATWIRDRAWAKEENISSFAGQPLLFRGEILGVLALFSRSPLTTTDMSYLRTFADNAAAAIANARAFEEIAQLKNQLEQENEYLRDEIATAATQGDIIGESPALQKTLQQVELVAKTDTSVLIEGESGTGKELIARRIHELSDRKDHPLIKVNCASIPRDLFESEFFGHTKGAFTGAVRDRIGRFELAHNGTLFLDEIGEIPLELQSKLLRTLQEGTFERVGEERVRQTNVRIIAATNRNLKKECEAGRFRQDLYFRLSVFPIEIAPLRIRRDDIPLLAINFLERARKRLGYPSLQLKNKHIQQLQNYPWPGNIRELQNVIERAAIISQGTVLQIDLPNQSAKTNTAPETETQNPLPTTYTTLKTLERNMILQALTNAEGKISGKNGAANQLGIPPSTLASKMAKMGIQRKFTEFTT